MNLTNYYQNKVVLITGGSMGIGKELARQVLQFGGKVVITGRNPERLQSVQSEFQENKSNLLIHAGNVVDCDDNIQLIQNVVLHFGKLDVLINNAALSAYGEMEKYDYKVINEIIDTNVKGVLFPTIASIPELKKTKGSVVFVSSIAAFRGLPGYSLYSLSKMALTSIVQSLQIEVKSNKIFVGIAYVGFTKNENEKRILSAKGIPEKVPARNKMSPTSRTITARKILIQIAAKKHRVVHSTIGKVSFFLSKYFPFLLKRIYTAHYQNNSNSTSQ